MSPDSPYVQERDGQYYVGSSQVSLDSIIIYWQQGDSPEHLHEAFPSAPLAAIYGAIAYYLDHREVVDRYLREHKEWSESQRAADEAANPEFYAMMRRRFAEAAHRLGLEYPREPAPDGEREAASTLGA